MIAFVAVLIPIIALAVLFVLASTLHTKQREARIRTLQAEKALLAYYLEHIKEKTTPEPVIEVAPPSEPEPIVREDRWTNL